MKKVIYKNKEYEVRLEKDVLEVISIYEKRKLFGITYLKEMYSVYESDLRDYLKSKDIYKEDVNYYIEEIKGLFELWEKHLELTYEKDRVEWYKLKALAEWDGVIDVN